ncbi:MAG TPA: MEDS domain-containing protein [Streptosporangiaceae bacterium]|nr:MEDS domain-containing protein [Streptosporangiaceae bacterium]
MGWAISGAGEFPVLAALFLAEGAALSERLIYVAEDPDPADVARLDDVTDQDALQVMSTAEVYGSVGIVDPARQRETFASLLTEALAAGFTGIRVAADNTPLVIGEERLRAWTSWEVVADRFIAENQVTGLCAFDQDRVDISRLRHLATLHPLSSASSPVPQFRLFSDAGALRVEGQLDSVAVTQLWLALDNLPPETGVVIDLESATVRGALTGLGQLCDSGVDVTIRGDRAAIGELTRSAGVLADRVVFEEA